MTPCEFFDIIIRYNAISFSFSVDCTTTRRGISGQEPTLLNLGRVSLSPISGARSRGPFVAPCTTSPRPQFCNVSDFDSCNFGSYCQPDGTDNLLVVPAVDSFTNTKSSPVLLLSLPPLCCLCSVLTSMAGTSSTAPAEAIPVHEWMPSPRSRTEYNNGCSGAE